MDSGKLAVGIRLLDGNNQELSLIFPTTGKRKPLKKPPEAIVVFLLNFGLTLKFLQPL
jgi:hypothetical protein